MTYTQLKIRKLVKPYTCKKYRNFGTIIIPAGITTTNSTAMDVDDKYNFVNEFDWVKESYPKIAELLIHEMVYYGLNIPFDYLTDIN